MKTATRPPTTSHAPVPEQQTTRSLGAGSWLRGKSQVASAKTMTYGLYGGLGLIALMALVAFVRPPAKPEKVKIPEPTVAAEGFAQMFVSTWLTANPGDSLAPFWPGRMDFGNKGLLITATPPPAPRVLRTASISASELGPDHWSITVGAQTQVGEGPILNRFFRVPVLRTRAQVYVATNTPAEVAGPVGSKAPELAVGSLARPEPNDPIALSVSQFLAALLAGQGELGRYIAPDSTVRPIRPVPFTAVEVSALSARKIGGDAKHLEVVATATGVDSVGHLTGLTYPLELVQRDGRWEVVRVLLAPSLSPDQPDLTATTVAPTSTTLAVPTTTTTPTSSTSTIRRN